MALRDSTNHGPWEGDHDAGILSGGRPSLGRPEQGFPASLVPGAMPRQPSWDLLPEEKAPQRPAPPEITFIRTDTCSVEKIEPPSPGGPPGQPYTSFPAGGNGFGPRSSSMAASLQSGLLSRSNSSSEVHRKTSRLSSGLDVFRSGRNRSASASTERSSNGELDSGGGSSSNTPKKLSTARRLSVRLHLTRNKSSEHVPQDLPAIAGEGREAGNSMRGTPGAKEAGGAAGGGGGGSGGDITAALNDEDHQRNWEARATILARETDKLRNVSRPGTPESSNGIGGGDGYASGARTPLPVSSKEIDDMIQEAIRLHEGGELERSTTLFAKLADPNGPNNALSQVLYGLALRHGWGCTPDLEAAVKYLSSAASNAAEIEKLALQAGLKKGGAAKGELVLAIFELANCFRQGWGIPKDPIAAKYYYETAANLGDTDAMNEVAWCYLEGFGTKKDKFAAAKYYRLAEKNGNKTIGNSWIWKEKYDPGHSKKK